MGKTFRSAAHKNIYVREIEYSELSKTLKLLTNCKNSHQPSSL